MNRKMTTKTINYKVICYIIAASVLLIGGLYATGMFIKPKPPTYTICCIMITGKDDSRIQYARASVQNFLLQTYPNKQLIIVNHHPHLKVLTSNNGITGIPRIPQLYEFHVEKSSDMTLGDLRNIALQMVPYDACWTTWDDDDYRAPPYLETLARFKTSGNIACITSRLEYNTNNGASWVGKKVDGFVLFLAPSDRRIKYTPRDSMEDIDILGEFKKFGYTVLPIDNDPQLYIRLVHTNNTSTYVNPSRDYLVRGPTYSERFTTHQEHVYITITLQKNSYIKVSPNTETTYSQITHDSNDFVAVDFM